ncbi:MAG TPA: RtcB family protein [archaeon]|nr:RtcB family protein [archaeon]
METRKLGPVEWELPKTGAMKVPVRIFASEQLLNLMHKDRTLQQIQNVACLPGIVNSALLMPDGHEGYGFPIGGVATFPADGTGLVSPGGIGYDINCGIRLLVSPLTREELAPRMGELMEALFKAVPSGLGSSFKQALDRSELTEILSTGVRALAKQGMASQQDLEHTEEGGCMPADPSAVSQRAFARGLKQAGTLGAGNHFVEVQEVEGVFGPAKIQKQFGLKPGQVGVMIHTGSRGLGHQVASDYIRVMLEASQKYGLRLPDRELAAAPLYTPEADRYLEAMKAAVNFAFVNRQTITHHVREVFHSLFGCELPLLYDVAHNIGKFETHGGRELFIHRKGATRAFGPGRTELPEIFRSTGQPIIIPGSMGTASYVLVGLGFTPSFESTCHGAGRLLSRGAAVRELATVSIKKQLEARGVAVMTGNIRGLAEEAPQAYKDIDAVVKVVQEAGISAPVARLVPLGVVKG